MSNRITELFGIARPVVAGGMAWCSGWRLAAAVTNEGGLGLIGAGSMTPDILEENIVKCREAVQGRTYGVNIPLANPNAAKVMELVEKYRVPVVFTSAGSPKKWTSWLHERGVKVAHVVASSVFARKCEEAGVDAVVAEGFEAGGHNGREETTTMCLIPAVRRATTLPLIAAGGIATGDAILAAEALGAEGVQIGTRFAFTAESSASEAFKRVCLNLNEGDTRLILKKLSPTRLVANKFRTVLEEAEARDASAEELLEIIGVGRARMGMFDGDVENGELEIGQIAALFKGRDIQTVAEAMAEMQAEYNAAKERLKEF
ncbi:MAG: nitronate monooxygenase [Bacteroidaceae bacterium]|nr:nitronate monooxygenase [Bacteroidaceae bacterium]MCF0184347.1 nitronate monooxygenase [Bacteroidaceae bacterium]